MRFNPKARLDTRRTRHASGGGGGGGGGRGISVPGGVGGGSIGGIVVTVIIAAAIYFLSDGGGGGSQSFDSDRYAACQSGEDANASADCARVAVENSLDDYWDDTVDSYRPIAALTTFTGSVSTQCGNATSDVGPFYCPVDEGIYLDSGFFDDVLERQLGGPDGGFVEAYVLAHEYGHHLQNVLGYLGRVRTQQGPQSDAVRLELQADCFAGMWARSATRTDDASGEALISELTDDDIRLALEAAATVGDDRIQQQTQGQVTEESWTHGSAEQRMRWFRVGFDTGSLEECDTFAVPTV